MMASTRSPSVDELQAIHAGAGKRHAQLALAPLGDRGEALAEAPVVRVDEQLLAGLGVLHDQQAQIGQLHLQRIVEPHRHHLVALREMRQRLRPSRAR